MICSWFRLLRSALSLYFAHFLMSGKTLDARFLQKPERIELSDQSEYYQGDIKLKNQDQIYRNAIKAHSWKKWTNAEVPYFLDGFGPKDKRTIIRAMKKIEADTCVRFLPVNGQRNFLHIKNSYAEGCFSSVGMEPGVNVVNLESSNLRTCTKYDIVIHELLHTLGLWHEHMRYDRDSFVRINYDSIREGFASQFAIVSPWESDTHGLPYDYRSVMHYKSTAFSKDGRPTILSLDASQDRIIGRVRDASAIDLEKINRIYCPNAPKPPAIARNPASTCRDRSIASVCQSYKNYCFNQFMKITCQATCHQCTTT